MTEKELARGAARRLAIIRHAQEVTGNVALTCRYFGITRQAYYIWLRRYQEQGLEGLRDRSRRPHVSPNATDAEVVDCTRIRVLRIYDRLNQTTAIRFLDYVLEKLPFKVEVIQTDHGAEFGSQFHYHVLDRGIGHVYIKPATPRLNGKVERSHRIDQEEFYRMLEGVVIDDTELFNDRLQEWERFYNFNRPHGGLGGQTPYERLRDRTRARA